jgi:hypothetical protein
MSRENFSNKDFEYSYAFSEVVPYDQFTDSYQQSYQRRASDLQYENYEKLQDIGEKFLNYEPDYISYGKSQEVPIYANSYDKSCIPGYLQSDSFNDSSHISKSQNLLFQRDAPETSFYEAIYGNSVPEEEYPNSPNQDHTYNSELLYGKNQLYIPSTAESQNDKFIKYGVRDYSKSFRSNSILGGKTIIQIPRVETRRNSVKVFGKRKTNSYIRKMRSNSVFAVYSSPELKNELKNINFEDVTVSQLKEILRKRGIIAAGKKEDLVKKVQDEINMIDIQEEDSIVDSDSSFNDHCQ